MRAAVVVAHPDDETLWAGGTILTHPEWIWSVATLCRASDPDRAPRFRRALEALGAEGLMADLDDGPEQRPLADAAVEEAVLATLPRASFDLVLTHSPRGEYTRHRRHEETGRAVAALWSGGRLTTDRVWTFAYGDGGGRHLPRAEEDADRKAALPEDVWERKHRILTGIYAFAADSFEARTTPRVEAFRCFDSAAALERWTAEKEAQR